MSSSTSYADRLGQIGLDITLYIDLMTFILGTIGCIGNLLIFTSHQLRKSSAKIYLLCTTVSQLMTILVCIQLRVFYDRSGSNLQNESAVFCKFRYYVAVAFPALASNYILLAAIDRYLLTSDDARIRTWNQIKIAKCLVLVTFVTTLLLSTHIFFFFDIFQNACQIQPGSVYTFIFGGYLIIVVILAPHMLMLTFSVLTIFTLRKSRRRVIPATRENRILNRRRTLELKLIQIIVTQVLLSVLLSSLRFGSASYRSIVFAIIPPTMNEKAAEGFAERLGSSLYFFNYATPFYAAMLTSPFFRRAFFQRLRFFYRQYIEKILGRHSTR
ncbi:unnamed protein product [Adineta ricciae]|uniref:G-protein coupled receptors family 1 profile domain-containing protein n=1 Tax=Adineta ricciae TaxID=249248 RepID=A0A815HIV9_ADIRI|nr:unnamed protein product [Adineta ricciae]CAF1477505.1 unnamed protein product [Adineta ricciae]